MIRKEKVNPKKIIQINYSYNFKLFNQFKSSTEKKTIFNKENKFNYNWKTSRFEKTYSNI